MFVHVSVCTLGKKKKKNGKNKDWKKKLKKKNHISCHLSAHTASLPPKKRLNTIHVNRFWHLLLQVQIRSTNHTENRNSHKRQGNLISSQSSCSTYTRANMYMTTQTNHRFPNYYSLSPTFISMQLPGTYHLLARFSGCFWNHTEKHKPPCLRLPCMLDAAFNLYRLERKRLISKCEWWRRRRTNERVHV